MRKISFLTAIFSLVVMFSAQAVDYTNSDVLNAINNVNDYNNVTVGVTRNISSASDAIYFGGVISGDVTITNSANIFPGDKVINLASVGNNSLMKTVSVVNNASGDIGSGNTSTIFISGKIDGSVMRSYNFQLNNQGSIQSADASDIEVVNGDSGSFNITNSGSIQSNFNDNPASAILLSGNNATITNSGIIAIFGSEPNLNAIKVTGNNFTLNILDGSTITGKIVAQGSNNVLNIQKNITVTELNTLSNQLVGSWVKNILSGSSLTAGSGDSLSIGSGESASNITLASGASISNSGTLGSVTSSGGTLNLAAGSSTGNIANSGALTIAVPSSEVTYSNAISGTAQS